MRLALLGVSAGYVYVLFETDKSVKALLQACTHDFSNGGEYYFKISSRRMRSKEARNVCSIASLLSVACRPCCRSLMLL